MADKKTIDDLFSFKDRRSLVRRNYNGNISLGDYPDLPVFKPDNSYKTVSIVIGPDEDAFSYLPKITEICTKGKHTGKQEKFLTAVYEAFRNAYQHGNKRDPAKKIHLSYRIGNDFFEVVVSDEGREMLADFIPFVMMHQVGLDTACSFYEFSDAKEKLDENSGIGTFIIHYSSDEVKYFKNEFGGLSIALKIKARK